MKTMKNILTALASLVVLSLIAFFIIVPALKLNNSNAVGVQKAEVIHIDLNRYAEFQIVKLRNCEYVLWHNGHGSDMEHYAGCTNPQHCN